MLLVGAGQEPRDILESEYWYIEAIAGAYKAGAFLRGSDTQHPGQNSRLVGNDADRAAAEMREPDHDTLGELLVHLKERPLVDDHVDDILDVVGMVGVLRHDAVESLVFAIKGIVAFGEGGRLAIVLRHVLQELFEFGNGVGFVFAGEMRHPGFGGMGHGPAEFLGGHLLMSDGFDDIGTGDEHVRGPLGHENEIGDGRAVDGSPGAGTEDDRDLRHHARGERVEQEDVGIAAEGYHTLLDARAAGIVEADHGGAHFHGHFHDFAYFLGVGLRERSAEHRKVLREDEHHATVDLAATGDDAVTEVLLLGQAEIARAVGHEHIAFDEAVGIHQKFDALARREFALFVLGLDAFLAAAQAGLGAHLLQLV